MSPTSYERRRPNVTSGSADPTGAELVAGFCAKPFSTSVLDGLYGLPGSRRTRMTVTYEPLCADGITPWGPGGAACP
jgi:hypothetical protein